MPSQSYNLDQIEFPDGTAYNLRDSRVDNLSAADISYNNTSSGMSASTTQEAIDELNTNITTLGAEDISYDNTTSGLSSTDTQDAIDELADDISNLEIPTVSVTQIQSTGTKIATITVDNVDTDLYAPNGGGGSSWTDVTGTLTAGQTSITLSDNSITTTSTIEVFNDLDVVYNSITVATGSVTLTFDAQQSDMSVKVRVS